MSWRLSLRRDLTPATLLWGDDSLSATAKNARHHSGDGDSKKDLANELHNCLLYIRAIDNEPLSRKDTCLLGREVFSFFGITRMRQSLFLALQYFIFAGLDRLQIDSIVLELWQKRAGMRGLNGPATRNVMALGLLESASLEKFDSLRGWKR